MDSNPHPSFINIWKNEMMVNITSEKTQKKSQEVQSTEPEFVGKCISNITVHISISKILG